MCSITDNAAAAPVPAAGLAALVAHEVEVGDLIAALLRDPRVAGRAESQPARTGVDVGELPPDLAAELCTALPRAAGSRSMRACPRRARRPCSPGPATCASTRAWSAMRG